MHYLSNRVIFVCCRVHSYMLFNSRFREVCLCAGAYIRAYLSTLHQFRQEYLFVFSRLKKKKKNAFKVSTGKRKNVHDGLLLLTSQVIYKINLCQMFCIHKEQWWFYIYIYISWAQMNQRQRQRGWEPTRCKHNFSLTQLVGIEGCTANPRAKKQTFV